MGISSEERRQQAEKRRKDIKKELSCAKYGIISPSLIKSITEICKSISKSFYKEM